MKLLHIDQLLSSITDRTSAKFAYEVALLSKPPRWASEEEMRFVSKKQSINVQITDSKINRLVLGSGISAEGEMRIADLVRSLPYDLHISKQAA